MKSNNFKYTVSEECDEIFDEKGNSFLALRKICWGDREEKLDLRKWFVNSEGEETIGKGFSFLTEEGPNELTKILVDRGYGDTDEILQALKQRDDFKKCLNNLDGSDEDVKIESSEESEYYDVMATIF